MENDESRGKLERLIEAAFPGAPIVFTDEGTDVVRLAREAVQRGTAMIIVGGGDGTVNGVASAVAGTVTILGVLPLGTLNHFARDLGMPTELEAAVQALATGNVMDVDVGEVNGSLFVNNSALGLYPEIVRQREKRQRQGASKWLAAFWAVVRALVRYRLFTIRVTAPGKQLVRMTPIVFVGNNEYVMEGPNIGTRSRLDGGKLCMYIPRTDGRLRLLWLTVRAILGHGHADKDFDVMLTSELSIQSRRPRVSVTLDGEVTSMTCPLDYHLRPGALHVIVPRPAE